MIAYGSMFVWRCHLSLAVTTVIRGANGSLGITEVLQIRLSDYEYPPTTA